MKSWIYHLFLLIYWADLCSLYTKGLLGFSHLNWFLNVFCSHSKPCTMKWLSRLAIFVNFIVLATYARQNTNSIKTVILTTNLKDVPFSVTSNLNYLSNISSVSSEFLCIFFLNAKNTLYSLKFQKIPGNNGCVSCGRQ